MEGVHGVDVSWLHHSNKDHAKLKQSTQKVTGPSQPMSSVTLPPSQPLKPVPEDQVNAMSTTPGPEALPQLPMAMEQAPPAKPGRRPSLRGKMSKEKLFGGSPRNEDGKPMSRKPSWMSSLGAKFSSSSSSNQGGPSTAREAPQFGHSRTASSSKPTPPATPTKELKSNPLITPTQGDSSGDIEAKPEPSTPPPQKEKSSFFSALRRLSSSTGTSGSAKAASSGYVCPRRVLNIDTERERPKVKELDQSKLRRVAFSVDVEVAGVSRYIEDQEPSSPLKKTGDKRLKDKGEGEALKHPQILKEAKEKDAKAGAAEHRRRRSSQSMDDILESEMLANAKQTERNDAVKMRQEKQEKRQKEAEDLGKVPKEANPTSPDRAQGQAQGTSVSDSKEPQSVTPQANGELNGPRPQDRPTTDPLRMYRRCCQLREAPVLKRISEQLGALKNNTASNPGIVDCLDLNGSRLQLPDLVCLGDWLAIVPVKTLLMDNANLSDEGLRVVLAGLLAAKPPGLNKRKRGRSSPNHLREKNVQRTPGVVEKISLRGNVKITRQGWTHLCLFIHMSRSIKSIDMTITPFPKYADPETLKSTTTFPSQKPFISTADLLLQSLSQRYAGSTFEELILSDCGLTSDDTCRIVDAAAISGLKRLGLAKSHLDAKAMERIAEFIRSGKCVGLDLGGNDLRDTLVTLANSMQSDSPLMALGLADCNLDSDTFRQLLICIMGLPDLRFLDLSHNRDLFAEEKSSIGSLRKYLPQCKWLRRVHLIDVSMTPSQAIGIIEVLPEVRNLNHISILENEQLKALAHATTSAAQEDACAFYASMMVAVRVSKTLLAVEMDPPGSESSEVVSALAKQTLAYSLRNMERWTAHDAMKAQDPAALIPDTVEPELDVSMPEVLAHLVGYPEDQERKHKSDELGPNQDYLVSGTGVAKALSYMLGQKDADLRRVSTVLPGNGMPQDSQAGKARAKAMSKNLLISARKIRERLNPAMAREALAGNEMDHRKRNTSDGHSHILKLAIGRLQFLEQTLQGMIQRFEDEFPECRVGSPDERPSTSGPSFFPLSNSLPPQTGSDTEPVERSVSPHASQLSSDSEKSMEAESTGSHPTDTDVSRDSFDPKFFDFRSSVFGSVASRRASETSMAARAQSFEEGRMHRLGQRMRRDVLPPKGQDDHLHRTSVADAPEPTYIAALRRQLEAFPGEDLKEKVLKQGLEATVAEFSQKAEVLKESEGIWPTSSEQKTQEKNNVVVEVMNSLGE
ncbi:MAG: hypothetical protein M1828_006537 [Chrysothrix sp. TS-e1954]|nr:MAG: hypothetical protein M1828_006537 [Chrysothrix sp. TS-e1954]